MTYPLPDPLKNQELTIRAYTQKEENLSDNTVSTELGLADVSIENLYLSDAVSGSALKAEIKNIGYKEASNLMIKVYDKSEEGEVIKTASISRLSKQESQTVELSIPEKYLDVDPLANGNALYVVVSSDSQEEDYANNSRQYLIYSKTEKPILLNYEEVKMKKNDTLQLKVVYGMEGTPEEEIHWISENETVVSVTDGRLQAKGTGQTTVKAVVRGLTASCSVRVNQEIAVSDLYIEETGIRILQGETKKLTARILPADAANQSISWKSEDNTIAVVSEDGTVKGLGVGTTEIIVRSESSGKNAICRVKVYQEEDLEYTLTFLGGSNASGKRPSAITGTSGEMAILPENMYKKEGYHFTGWNDGKTVYEAGSAYRIPYHDVSFVAEWEADEAEQKAFSIIASGEMGGSISPSGTVNVTEGESQTFQINPDADYEIKDVLVDGKSIGAVSSYTFENVDKTHEIKASFSKKETGNTEEPLAEKKKQKFIGTQTYQKTFGDGGFLLDTMLKEGDGDISYSSSNTKVATVSVSGRVVLRGAGTTEITVIAEETEEYQKSSYTIWLTVKKAEQSMEGTEKYEKREGDKEFTLDVELVRGTGELLYTSTNEKVVNVTKEGRVSIVGEGNATILVTASETEEYLKQIFEIRITVKKNEETQIIPEQKKDTEGTKTEEKTVQVEKIILNKTKAKITVGQTLKLTATVSPANAVNTQIKWSSTDAKVAIVHNGQVKALSSGKVTIWAVSAGNNSIKAVCSITVLKPSLKISGKSKVKRGKAITLTAKVKNITGKIKWSLDKKSKKLAKLSKSSGNKVKLTTKKNAKKKSLITVIVKVGNMKKSKKIKIG